MLIVYLKTAIIKMMLLNCQLGEIRASNRKLSEQTIQRATVIEIILWRASLTTSTQDVAVVLLSSECAYHRIIPQVSVELLTDSLSNGSNNQPSLNGLRVSPPPGFHYNLQNPLKAQSQHYHLQVRLDSKNVT